MDSVRSLPEDMQSELFIPLYCLLYYLLTRTFSAATVMLASLNQHSRRKAFGNSLLPSDKSILLLGQARMVHPETVCLLSLSLKLLITLDDCISFDCISAGLLRVGFLVLLVLFKATLCLVQICGCSPSRLFCTTLIDNVNPFSLSSRYAG